MARSLHAPLRHRSSLQIETDITLEAIHVKALRARDVSVKEAFTLIDADGRFFRAALRTMKHDGGTARVYEEMSESTESPAQITLYCAVLARQRMMVVMQKATELGVTRIVPVISERSVPRDGLDHQKASSWPKQVQRAARQCRRASLPFVDDAMEFRQVLDDADFAQAETRIHLDNESMSLRRLSSEGETKIAFAVGPEGGWTDGERALLAERRALAFNLGARVLRAETAVVVGLTLIQRAYGDF